MLSALIGTFSSDHPYDIKHQQATLLVTSAYTVIIDRSQNKVVKLPFKFLIKTVALFNKFEDGAIFSDRMKIRENLHIDGNGVMVAFYSNRGDPFVEGLQLIYHSYLTQKEEVSIFLSTSTLRELKEYITEEQNVNFS